MTEKEAIQKLHQWAGKFDVTMWEEGGNGWCVRLDSASGGDPLWLSEGSPSIPAAVEDMDALIKADVGF